MGGERWQEVIEDEEDRGGRGRKGSGQNMPLDNSRYNEYYSSVE
jgi:hypothetical protein